VTPKTPQNQAKPSKTHHPTAKIRDPRSRDDPRFQDLLLRMNLQPYMSKSCEEVLPLVEDIPRLANAL